VSTPAQDATLTVDDLQFELRRSSRRRTLEITVDRNGELVITAPPDCSTESMSEFVREKRFWIYTKLVEKEALRHPTPEKRFVSGEGFPYLGRRYRLLLVDQQEVPLQLKSGRFQLLRSEAERGRDHFVRWYGETGLRWLARRVPRFASRIGVTVRDLRVRDLGYRWGSCSADGTVNFHWASLMFPPSIIDYVIVHELVHLLEKHHTPEFWQRVERAMPDFETRTAWLAERGGREVGW
jgi:predicted metal-dependent hydrolase